MREHIVTLLKKRSIVQADPLRCSLEIGSKNTPRLRRRP